MSPVEPSGAETRPEVPGPTERSGDADLTRERQAVSAVHLRLCPHWLHGGACDCGALDLTLWVPDADIGALPDDRPNLYRRYQAVTDALGDLVDAIHDHVWAGDDE